jgi:hypothetical protein
LSIFQVFKKQIFVLLRFNLYCFITIKVFDEVFKWENYDKEHAQGRSNFQIEKFIALDNFTIASSFNALLKNRRIMAEGLFSKITEMKERQREFDFKWENKPKDEPIEWFTTEGGKKLCWYDLDLMNLENFLRSSELEIRDRTQQIEYNSNKNFIRKWGSRNSDVKYNIAFVVKNGNLRKIYF